MWNNGFCTGNNWTGMGILLVFWLLFLLALAFGIFWAFGHRSGQPGAPAPRTSDSQRLLDERFARGELEVEDYKARRDALTRD